MAVVRPRPSTSVAQRALARGGAGQRRAGSPGYGPGSAPVFALVAAVMVGASVDLATGITPGLLALAVLGPVWWPCLARFRGLRPLVGVTGVTLVFGALLAWIGRAEQLVDVRNGFATAVLVAVGFAGVAVLAWASTCIPVELVALAFGVGVLLREASSPSTWAGNPWKFGLSMPVGIILLAGVAVLERRTGRRRLWLPLTVLLLIGATSAVTDYRSLTGFALLAILLLAWQRLSTGSGRRLRNASPALLLVASAGAVYLIATQLFVGGFLGSDVQARSQAQIQASGSLLLGGRPEWSATVQLMELHPWGYGFGVVPGFPELQASIAGFSGIHVDPATGYVAYIEQYMLKGQFQLHSVAADLWALAGPMGLLLAAITVVLVLWGMSVALARGRADALLVFFVINCLWDIGFSPLFSAIPEVTLALFLAVVALTRARADTRPASASAAAR